MKKRFEEKEDEANIVFLFLSSFMSVLPILCVFGSLNLNMGRDVHVTGTAHHAGVLGENPFVQDFQQPMLGYSDILQNNCTFDEDQEH